MKCNEAVAHTDLRLGCIPDQITSAKAIKRELILGIDFLNANKNHASSPPTLELQYIVEQYCTRTCIYKVHCPHI